MCHLPESINQRTDGRESASASGPASKRGLEERRLETRSFVKRNPRCGCNLQRVVYRLGYFGEGRKR